jgi:CRISPR/Cas system CSM-associated protein Csm5 (group 7 of RAMP superfamily)
MASPIERTRWQLTTCSPVFVGSGDKATPAEYIIEDKFFYLINDGAMSDLLLFNKDYPKKYATFIETLGAQKASHQHRGQQLSLLGDVFLHQPPRMSHLPKIVSHPQVIKVGHNVSTPLTKPLDLFMQGSQGFYIPGSSIKGALRTLLLQAYVKGLTPQQQSTLLKESDLEDAVMSLIEGDRDIKTSDVQAKLNRMFQAIRIADSDPIDPSAFVVMQPASFNQYKEDKGIDIEPTESMLNPIIALKAGEKVTFEVSLDRQQLKKLEKDFVPLPFKVGSAKALFEQACAMASPPDTLGQANFYVGGKTGFNRHTLWDVLDNEEVATACKNEVLPRLPKPRGGVAAPKRNPTDTAPRTYVIQSKNNITPLGWCKLEPLPLNAPTPATEALAAHAH